MIRSSFESFTWQDPARCSHRRSWNNFWQNILFMDLILKKKHLYSAIWLYVCVVVFLVTFYKFPFVKKPFKSFSNMNFQEELGNGDGLPLIFYPRHQSSSNMKLQDCKLRNGLCEGFPVVKNHFLSKAPILFKYEIEMRVRKRPLWGFPCS